MKIISNIAVRCIDYYHNSLSMLKISSCRYHPTCSTYTREAVLKYGVIKGALKGALRILRCHPFSKRGPYDPLV